MPEIKAPKEKGTEKAKKESLFDFAKAPFVKWLDFIKARGLEYWKGLFRINLIAFLIASLLILIYLLILAGLFFAFGGVDSIKNMDIWALLILVFAFMAVSIVVFFIVSWIQNSISLTALAYTDSEFTKQGFGISSVFSKIKFKVLLYMLALVAIEFIISIPILLVLLFLFGSGILMGFLSSASGGASIMMPMVIILLIAMFYIIVLIFSILRAIFDLIFAFISQFWTFEFIIEGRGVLDALKASFSIVKNRALETLIFNAAWGIAISLLMIPLIFVSLSLQIGFRLLPFLMERFGLAEIVIIYLVLIVFASLLSVFFSTIMQVFSLPTHYLYWKKAKGSLPK